MTQICNWTDSQKMKLKEDKSKAMIFNFSKKYQFSTRILMKSSNLEIVQETKIFRTNNNTQFQMEDKYRTACEKSQQKAVHHQKSH